MTASVIAVVALGVPACTHGYYAWSAASSAQVRPREPECLLNVVETWPYPGYVVLGTLTWDGIRAPQAIDDFHERIREDVCAVGGEVVVVQRNDGGHIMRAAVLGRMTPPGAAGPPPAPR